MLEMVGHRVAVEQSAQAALARAGKDAFEVILLDIGLPEMSDHVLTGVLRQLPCYVHSALVAVSGYGQEQDRRMSKEAGLRRT